MRLHRTPAEMQATIMNKFDPETPDGLEAITQIANHTTANSFYMETGIHPCELIVKLADEVKQLRKQKEGKNDRS